MFILGINGSPNKEGNTSLMIQTGLEIIREMGVETRILHVSDVLKGVKVPFCNLCSDPCEGACSRNNSLGEAYAIMSRADGIIIGSPVYFGTVSAQLKGFWDKTRFLRRNKSLINVVGGALAVGGARFGGQETTVRAIQDMMLVQGMTVVGDGFMDEDAGHQGACAQRPAVTDEFGMKRAVILAKRIVELAKATDGLRNRQ